MQDNDFDAYSWFCRTGLEGTRPNVVGWGYTAYDPWQRGQQGDVAESNVAAALQQRLDLPVLSTDECLKKFRDYPLTLIQISLIGWVVVLPEQRC